MLRFQITYQHADHSNEQFSHYFVKMPIFLSCRLFIITVNDQLDIAKPVYSTVVYLHILAYLDSQVTLNISCFIYTQLCGGPINNMCVF